MPGARTSGLAKPSRVGPVADQAGRTSSDQSPAVRVAVQCAHGDHVGVVARHGDRLCSGAVVARGSHHHDAVGPGRFDGPVQRIDEVGRGGVGAQAEVHDPDVEGVLVGDDVLDAFDRRRRRCRCRHRPTREC